MNTPRPRARLPHVLFAIYLALCLLGSTWPGYALVGARLEPRILGLPFAFAWTIGWVLATFLALILYHRAVGRRD
jgi:hypothetical protein